MRWLTKSSKLGGERGRQILSAAALSLALTISSSEAWPKVDTSGYVCGKDPKTLTSEIPKEMARFVDIRPVFRGKTPCNGDSCFLDILDTTTNKPIGSFKLPSDRMTFCTTGLLLESFDQPSKVHFSAPATSRLLKAGVCHNCALSLRYLLVFEEDTGTWQSTAGPKSFDHIAVIQWVGSARKEHRKPASWFTMGLANGPGLSAETWNSKGTRRGSALSVMEIDSSEHARTVGMYLKFQ
jgi:hypothetical protein